MARPKDAPAAPEAAPPAPRPEAPEAAVPPEGGPAPDDGTPAGEAPPSPAAPGLPGPMGGDDDATAEPALLVRGPAKGRWRTARRFGPEPVVLLVEDLTEAEIAALRADPELLVTEA